MVDDEARRGRVPGVPDLNQSAVGQHLLNPRRWRDGQAAAGSRNGKRADVLTRPARDGTSPRRPARRRLRDGYDIGAATAVSDPAP